MSDHSPEGYLARQTADELRVMLSYYREQKEVDIVATIEMLLKKQETRPAD